MEILVAGLNHCKDTLEAQYLHPISLCLEFPSHHQWLRQSQIFIYSGAPAAAPSTARSPEQWTPKTQQRPQLRVREWIRTLSVQQPGRTLFSQRLQWRQIPAKQDGRP